MKITGNIWPEKGKRKKKPHQTNNFEVLKETDSVKAASGNKFSL